MKTLGYLRKKQAAEISASPWGMQYLPREYPHDLLVQRVGESGAKWARLSVKWPDVEIEKGRWDWSLVDRLVDGLCANGVNIFLGASCGSHPTYQDFPEGYYYPPTDEPAALEGYARFGAALVERYRDRVRHYEIWNEPNIMVFWRPEPDPKAYALLTRTTSAAMKAVDPDIKVLGGVFAGVGEKVRQYADAWLSEPGTPEAIDILCYHAYNPSPEETYEDILAMREVVHAHRANLPFWQGECGCPSSGDTIHFRGDAPWGYNVQSKWLLRRLLTDYMAGSEVSIYFLVVEFYGNLRPGSPELRFGYNTKGLVQHTTWATKPAFSALQNLAATIDSSWKPVSGKAAIEVVNPGTFYGIGPHEDRFPCVPWQLGLERDGVPMLAYWLPWRPQEIVRPATVRITRPDHAWTRPVCVDLLSGAVTEAKAIGKEVEAPMADYPMIVTEAGALDLATEPQQPSYEEIIAKLRWTF